MVSDTDPGPAPDGAPGVEIYRAVGGKRTWKVRAVAVDRSPDALRDAARLALDVEAQVCDELRDRYAKPGAEGPADGAVGGS